MKNLKRHIYEIRSKGIFIIFSKLQKLINSYTLILLKRILFILYLGFIFSSFKKKNNDKLKSDKIIFGTVVWGDFIKLYTKFTLPSLLASHNIPLLISSGYKIKLLISTNRDINFEKNIRILISKHININKVEIEFHHNENMKSSLLNQYLNKIYEQSVNENAIIWSAHPDHCYSNGSVSNLISMIDSDDCCIAAPHFRVDEDKFIKVFNLNNSEAYNNHEFINVSINCFHKSLLKSFDNQKLNNSWLTGISIKKIHKNKMFVNHIVPTVFVAKINKSDLKFFKKRTYNSFDMSWPSKLLIEKRLRFVSSSDIFFAIELTENNLNEDYKFTYKFNPRNDLKRNMHSNILGSFTYVINYYK